MFFLMFFCHSSQSYSFPKFIEYNMAKGNFSSSIFKILKHQHSAKSDLENFALNPLLSHSLSFYLSLCHVHYGMSIHGSLQLPAYCCSFMTSTFTSRYMLFHTFPQTCQKGHLLLFSASFAFYMTCECEIAQAFFIIISHQNIHSSCQK